MNVKPPARSWSEDPDVHVIDDDEEIRMSLDSLFRSIGLKTGLYGSAGDFLDTNNAAVQGCLVVDVRLPGLSGLDFQDQLVRAGLTIPVIFMTGHGDIPMSVRAMKAGAVDFLPKPFRDQDMLDAVATALQRCREQREAEQEFAGVKARYAELSPREKQVVALVTAGLMNKQIAAVLSLSEVTVKLHRGTAMRKMKARTLADLVRMAEHLRSQSELIEV